MAQPNWICLNWPWIIPSISTSHCEPQPNPINLIQNQHHIGQHSTVTYTESIQNLCWRTAQMLRLDPHVRPGSQLTGYVAQGSHLTTLDSVSWCAHILDKRLLPSCNLEWQGTKRLLICESSCCLEARGPWPGPLPHFMPACWAPFCSWLVVYSRETGFPFLCRVLFVFFPSTKHGDTSCILPSPFLTLEFYLIREIFSIGE